MKVEVGILSSQALQVIGEFQDLTDNGNEILATASKGLFVSKNDGRSWNKRN